MNNVKFIDGFTTPWGVEVKASWRGNTNDQNTLISCLEEDEYEIQKLPNKGVAVDLGAHIGGVTLALASKGLNVLAVEMFPENMKLLIENIIANGWYGEKVNVTQAAVVGYKGSDEKEVTAYYTDSSTEFGKAHKFIGTILENKFIGDTKKHGESIKVPVISLGELLKDVEVVEFMKVDIEGGEWEVISDSSNDTLNKIKRIAVEIEGLGGAVTTGDFLDLLPQGWKDVSEEYFPNWCKPGEIIHGYFINENL